MELLKKIEDQIGFWALLSLTLGLAPFAPEPHIWGKLKWIAGGANGMKAMDWFDTFLHGLPWVLLILASMLKIRSLVQNKKSTTKK